MDKTVPADTGIGAIDAGTNGTSQIDMTAEEATRPLEPAPILCRSQAH